MTSAFFPQLWRKLAKVEIDYATNHDSSEREKMEKAREIAREFALLAGIPIGICNSIARHAEDIGKEKDLLNEMTSEELVSLVLERSMAERNM